MQKCPLTWYGVVCAAGAMWVSPDLTGVLQVPCGCRWVCSCCSLQVACGCQLTWRLVLCGCHASVTRLDVWCAAGGVRASADLTFGVMRDCGCHASVTRLDGGCAAGGVRVSAPQGNLINCSWYADNACCQRTEVTSVFGDMYPLYGASTACTNHLNYLMCYFCSPEQYKWYSGYVTPIQKPAHIPACPPAQSPPACVPTRLKSYDSILEAGQQHCSQWTQNALSP